MNGTPPIPETIQPKTDANLRRSRITVPAGLFRPDEHRSPIRSPATAPGCSKKPAAARAAKRLLGSLLVGLAIAGCSSAKLDPVHDISHGPASRPSVVYVADFELASDSIQSESRRAALPPHAYVERLKAQSLVEEMSTTIVESLSRKGITAVRLSANSPLPQQGWLVRGVFSRVDEGNRVERAITGFGSGQTDVEVATATDELSPATPPAPLYSAQTDATSNKTPGAVITRNPYAAAAKFVMDGHDLDRSTHATAEKIADEVAARVKATPQ